MRKVFTEEWKALILGGKSHRNLNKELGVRHAVVLSKRGIHERKI